MLHLLNHGIHLHIVMEIFAEKILMGR